MACHPHQQLRVCVDAAATMAMLSRLQTNDWALWSSVRRGAAPAVVGDHSIAQMQAALLCLGPLWQQGTLVPGTLVAWLHAPAAVILVLKTTTLQAFHGKRCSQTSGARAGTCKMVSPCTVLTS